MTPTELARAIREHNGTFICSRINHPSEAKTVRFNHETTVAGDPSNVPDLGRLRAFYAAFGSVTFYVDEKSGDAARYIAPTAEWSDLHDHFAGWLEGLDASEREELPEWIDSCLVIGEEPRSGNYILMPTIGNDAGAVFHFEHDGFEFDRHADDLLQYAEDLLDLDDRNLAYVATHMRFVEDDKREIQWWIEELQDNRGNVARTRV